jgi:hypothetical protein
MSFDVRDQRIVEVADTASRGAVVNESARWWYPLSSEMPRISKSGLIGISARSLRTFLLDKDKQKSRIENRMTILDSQIVNGFKLLIDYSRM